MEQPNGRAVDCDPLNGGKGLGSGLQGLRPTKHLTPLGAKKARGREGAPAGTQGPKSARAEMRARMMPTRARSTLRSAGGSMAYQSLWELLSARAGVAAC